MPADEPHVVLAVCGYQYASFLSRLFDVTVFLLHAQARLLLWQAVNTYNLELFEFVVLSEIVCLRIVSHRIVSLRIASFRVAPIKSFSSVKSLVPVLFHRCQFQLARS